MISNTEMVLKYQLENQKTQNTRKNFHCRILQINADFVANQRAEYIN